VWVYVVSPPPGRNFAHEHGPAPASTTAVFGRAPSPGQTAPLSGDRLFFES